jgi:hypothetical protein
MFCLDFFYCKIYSLCQKFFKKISMRSNPDYSPLNQDEVYETGSDYINNHIER